MSIRKVKTLPKAPKTTSAQTLKRFATQAQRLVGLGGEVSVYITSSREMQEFNRRYRRKNQPTDVLSFPAAVPGVGGDVAISLEIADSNAAQMGHSLEIEVKILILHGMLHLAGYDHETDAGEMRAREAALRLQLGLPVGLIERTLAAPTEAKAKSRPKIVAKARVAGKAGASGRKRAAKKPGAAKRAGGRA